MYCCKVTVVRHIVHSDSKTLCASNLHVELAKQVVVLSGRAVSENSRSSYSVSELERIISPLNARPHDYHSRLTCRLCRFARDGPYET